MGRRGTKEGREGREGRDGGFEGACLAIACMRILFDEEGGIACLIVGLMDAGECLMGA